MNNILFCTGHAPRYFDMVRADNCRLFDDAGHEYLDLESGVWAMSLGHSHPRITEIIRRQSAELVHAGYSWYHPVIQSTAERILGIAGLPGGKCVFLCSGSEAVELGVNLARSVTGKPRFLSLKNCYLSAYGTSGKRAADEWVHLDWEAGDDIDRVPFDDIAAFVFEPGSSLGLVKFPPADYIARIVDRVRAAGGLVLVNEVTTGIGRTGRWFGCQHYDLAPDLVAMGKGLGNGYPVACLAVSAATGARIDYEKFHYAQSHQNDALGAAVAGEVLRVIEEDNLLAKCEADGEFLRAGLRELQRRHGIIKEVRGRGLMIAVEFEKNDAMSCAGHIFEKLLERRIILVRRPGLEVFRIDPALTVERGQLEMFLVAMGEIMGEMG